MHVPYRYVHIKWRCHVVECNWAFDRWRASHTFHHSGERHTLSAVAHLCGNLRLKRTGRRFLILRFSCQCNLLPPSRLTVLPSVCQRIASLNSLLAPLLASSPSSSLVRFFQKSMKSVLHCAVSLGGGKTPVFTQDFGGYYLWNESENPETSPSC